MMTTYTIAHENTKPCAYFMTNTVDVIHYNWVIFIHQVSPQGAITSGDYENLIAGFGRNLNENIRAHVFATRKWLSRIKTW